MTNPKRRYSGNDVGYMEEECKANMRLTAENKRLEAELGESQLRLAGAVALLPDEITCGQLREERDKAEQLHCRIEELEAAVAGLRQNRDLAYATEKRLREALENAPEPGTGIIGAMHYKGTDAIIESVSYDLSYDLYVKWFNDVRSKALGKGE